MGLVDAHEHRAGIDQRPDDPVARGYDGGRARVVPRAARRTRGAPHRWSRLGVLSPARAQTAGRLAFTNESTKKLMSSTRQGIDDPQFLGNGTPEDQLAIERLLYRYAAALDERDAEA